MDNTNTKIQNQLIETSYELQNKYKHLLDKLADVMKEVEHVKTDNEELFKIEQNYIRKASLVNEEEYFLIDVGVNIDEFHKSTKKIDAYVNNIKSLVTKSSVFLENNLQSIDMRWVENFELKEIIRAQKLQKKKEQMTTTVTQELTATKEPTTVQESTVPTTVQESTVPTTVQESITTNETTITPKPITCDCLKNNV